MNILVIGNGAREHSICWSLKKSKKCGQIFCAPGNAGTAIISTNIKIDPKNKNEICNFCKKNSIELVVIGPEQYLEIGLSDFLIKRGIKVFGPTKRAAMLETSKSFSKKFLERNKIPTPSYVEFTNFQKAKKYIQNLSYPIVLKANGLAAGKGVIICSNNKEANKAIDILMKEKKFGSAGKKIIVEQFLTGFEVSYFLFIDKKSFSILGYALDHKRAYDFDNGPNTGGMGCFTPSQKMNKNLEKKIFDSVVKPTFLGLQKENFEYRGILFVGLMINKNCPYVIEFNARFGDPECQTLLRNLNSDLLELFESTVNDKLSKIKIRKDSKSVICVVVASKGYPESYKTNKEIKNLAKASSIEGIEIFHAGTKSHNKKILSSGGRVLSITSKSESMKDARIKAYEAIKIINWKFGFFRKDIGIKNN